MTRNRPEHDLQALLSEGAIVLDVTDALLQTIHITWAPAEQLDNDQHWAQWRRYPAAPAAATTGHWIGIHECLRSGKRRAPLYVLRYLVAHELLHVLLPPRGRCAHHRAFRIAERLLPDYTRAKAWLAARCG